MVQGRYFDILVALWLNSSTCLMLVSGGQNPNLLFAGLVAAFGLVFVSTINRTPIARLPAKMAAAVLAMNAAIILSYVLNADLYDSTFLLGNVISAWITFFMLYLLATRAELNLRVILLWCSIINTLVLPLVLASAQVTWGRTITTALHPNYVGMIALTGVIGALAARSVIVMIGLSIIPFYAMYEVQSRTSIMGGLLAIGVCIWMGSVHRLARRYGAAMVTAMLLLLAIAFVLVAVLTPLGDTLARMGNDVFKLNDEYRGISSGGSGRLELWQAAIGIWLDNPIAGVGFKGHPLQMPEQAMSHNAYLGVLADMGISGMFAYLALVIVTVASIFKHRDSDDFTPRVVLVATYLLYGVLENRAFGFGNPYSLLFLVIAFEASKVPVVRFRDFPNWIDTRRGRVPLTVRERVSARVFGQS